MPETKYLIVGCSHAGLSALDAIRQVEPNSPITVVSKETGLPYSPTALPYIFSGLADPERIYLRDASYFEKNRIELITGSAVTGLDSKSCCAELSDGRKISYEKVLLATGARPAVPDIEGLSQAPYLVLRTRNDAVALRDRIKEAGSAIILGAGLVGMHTAENLAMAGMKVAVVEMQPRVLPGYFDSRASGIIAQVFQDRGIRVFLGNPVTHITSKNSGCAVSLDNGLDLSADILLVATGVQPVMDYIDDPSLERERAVLVDDHMRTSLEGVWAAGDLVQARDFFGGGSTYLAALPNAVNQGRVAGGDMVQDGETKPYAGNVSTNTYSFFGQWAYSLGQSMISETDPECEVNYTYSPTNRRCQKLIFRSNRLIGAMGVNADLDPGVILELIVRETDLGDIMEDLVLTPKKVSRYLMTKIWR